jgi:hypothetical protein
MSFFSEKNETLSINDSKNDVKRFLLKDKKAKAKITVVKITILLMSSFSNDLRLGCQVISGRYKMTQTQL